MEEQKQMTSAPANAITEGVIWKQLLIFFFPIMLGTFFQQLYNTADAIIVGRFVGKEALAAVGGSANQISNLIIGFFVGVSSGATVIIAQHYGARKEEPLSHALHTAMAFCIFGSIVITVIGYAAAPVFLRWMNTPKRYDAGFCHLFAYLLFSESFLCLSTISVPAFFALSEIPGDRFTI